MNDRSLGRDVLLLILFPIHRALLETCPTLNSSSQIILLSGGLDSVVNLAMALEQGDVLLCLTFDYGQRAAEQEIEASKKVSAHYSLTHRVMRLPWMEGLISSALMHGEERVPLLSQEELNDSKKTKKTAQAVWVPNRNGLFINIAASMAESLGAGLIITGFNREEGETFPDNTKAFMDAINHSLEYSTLSSVKVVSYTAEMIKKEIVEAGIRRKAPFQHVWSCYSGQAKMCGQCESCLRLKRAIDGTDVEERLTRHFLE